MMQVKVALKCAKSFNTNFNIQRTISHTSKYDKNWFKKCINCFVDILLLVRCYKKVQQRQT